ncbi:MAG: hypothetical protein ACRDD7_07875 [Peptostreptococcaceae bacterium]
MKKNMMICLVVALGLFTVGCKETSTGTEITDSVLEQSINTNKINLEDSMIEVKDKLYKACFFDKENNPVKTMDESLEYVKSVLPEEVEEIENINLKEDGLTNLKYKIEDIVFYVVILHPYNGDSTYDFKSVSGISFPRIEIDTNWQSE